MLGSSEGSHEIVNAQPTHIHNYWAFTKPGKYVIGVEAFGKNAAGEFVSDKAHVTFQVESADRGPQAGETPGRSLVIRVQAYRRVDAALRPAKGQGD